MEDNGVASLATVSEIEEHYEPFQKSEDIDSGNDFIPDIDESSDCSDSDDADDEDFYNDELVENSHDVNDEYNPTEEHSMLLAQPLLHALLARNNAANVPASKFK